MTECPLSDPNVAGDKTLGDRDIFEIYFMFFPNFVYISGHIFKALISKYISYQWLYSKLPQNIEAKIKIIIYIS